MLNERRRAFAVAYCRLANATRAAEEAGYSKKRAHATGSDLMKDKDVLDFIAANRVRRDIHADVTYQNQIKLTNVAFTILNEALNTGGTELKEKVIACENARRCQETLARMEGLMHDVPMPKEDPTAMTLQQLAQKLKRGVQPALSVPVVEVRELTLTPCAEVKKDETPRLETSGAA